MENTQDLLKCAKGNWQKWILTTLLEEQTMENPIDLLRGRAKKLYKNRYKNSFNSLCERVETNGYKIVESNKKIKLIKM